MGLHILARIASLRVRSKQNVSKKKWWIFSYCSGRQIPFFSNHCFSRLPACRIGPLLLARASARRVFAMAVASVLNRLGSFLTDGGRFLQASEKRLLNHDKSTRA